MTEVKAEVQHKVHKEVRCPECDSTWINVTIITKRNGSVTGLNKDGELITSFETREPPFVEKNFLCTSCHTSFDRDELVEENIERNE